MGTHRSYELKTALQEFYMKEICLLEYSKANLQETKSSSKLKFYQDTGTSSVTS